MLHITVLPETFDFPNQPTNAPFQSEILNIQLPFGDG
jgi:hypothetical protein